MDAHKNFASSLVATAPSPASSGTSLVVTAAEGTNFPAVPFNATVWPANANPTIANAEIVRVTARTTDTLTITRAQESSSARTVVVGDQIAATITAKTLTDVEDVKRYGQPTYLSGGYYGCGGNAQATAGGWGYEILYCVPIFIGQNTTFDRIGVRCGAGTATLVVRLGIFNDNNGPTTVVLDAGTVDGASASADKTITISQTLDRGLYWLGACPQVAGSVGAGFVSTRAAYTQFLPYPWGTTLVSPARGYQQGTFAGAFTTVTPVLADFSTSGESMNVMLRAT